MHDMGSSNLWDLISALGKTYAKTGERTAEAVWRTLITNRASTATDPHVRYPASLRDLQPSFPAWIVWRYALAKDEPTTYPMSSFPDNIFPFQADLIRARRKATEDPAFLTSLAHAASLFDAHFCHSMFLRPFRTKTGFFGIGTQCLREGDTVWIVPGCRVPLIFRKSEQSAHRQLVGGAYVHGVMNGEALKDEGFSIRSISLE